MIFLYFLPALSKADVTPETVRAAGLGDVARDCLAPRAWNERTARMDVARGPSGSSGALLALLPVSGETPTIGCYPERQTWRPVRSAPDADPRYWLGWFGDDPPRPDTLARDRLVSGEDHELGDGRVWHCPIIRRPNRSTNLPERWGVDETGRFVASVEPDYEAFWTLSGEIFETAFGLRDDSPAWAWQAAVRCLSLNYRVGPHEATALNLLSSALAPRVCHAAIDAAAIKACVESMQTPAGRELLDAAFPDVDESKKNIAPAPDPNSTNSTPGRSDDCPITAPAAASCSP